MSRCDLYLDNYGTHYTSGETVIGNVLCTFTSPKKIHGITLYITGMANTQWSDRKPHYDPVTKKTHMRSIPFYGSQTLVNHRIDLLAGTQELPKGAYKYNFKYRLPQDLPSTFTSDKGQITYTIKAVVKCPFLEFNYEAQSPFVLITPVDLNLQPHLMGPIKKTQQKDTYFLLWNKGSINVKAKIPRSGFVIQELLPLHITVQNMSQSNIEHILCTLHKKTTFKTTSPSKRTEETSEVIFRDQYSGVGANGQNTWDKNVRIQDPVLISNFIDCNLIQVTYNLELTFVIAGMHTNIVLDLPVTIGHVPFDIKGEMEPRPPYHIGMGLSMNQSTHNHNLRQPAYNPDFNPDMAGPPLYPHLQDDPFATHLRIQEKQMKKSKEEDDEWEFVGFV